MVIPSNSILATINVKDLYLNIQHQDGIKAVVKLYYNNPNSDEEKYHRKQ